MTRAFKTLGALAVALVAAHAGAQQLHVQIPSDIEPARSELTRTEVLADLQLYRLAGIYELTRGINVFDAYSYPYRKRNATYQHLRQSPQYAQLLAELERNPHAQVIGNSIQSVTAGAPR